MSNIEIDAKSGFCFGVVNAIKKAEEELAKGGVLYCLGDIVHNNLEVDRLEKLGLKTINHEEFAQLKNARVLLRAHGEPPSTYKTAKDNNIDIIDASCPVVLRLQKKIHDKYDNEKDNNTQIVIYGKNGHAEVNGLLGQTDSSAIVIEKKDDLEKLDFSKNICLFSQTTKPLDGFQEIIDIIQSRMTGDASFEYFDTICRQVSNRIPNIKEFAQKHNIIFFVAGEKSSNGKVLFAECKKYNPNSYFITTPSDIDPNVLSANASIGICGATSTPKWQMEAVEAKIDEIRLVKN
ncbi:4-hydroxy-3-methylbut-2-enyl diphosphate reductase [Dysgonomonas sp. BGC7]|uniref:4-hydroxy-3-methylbut-2-enyl diphosphate reductase n=1 Tax=Dysgonomonas sp. BGC7 TaxID=1658008 RepID=UPI0006806E70|nr:4-hydroxy-3-methylbut-2-enyl diphosphate reductase [Dysgonomonas sp. BGC7]MBD8388266.1 4-hydroxy-3-methylbut-2-enyl diphosphate reductase [Dysgonomonas sp. BGC7]